MKSLLEIYLSEQDEPIVIPQKGITIHPDIQNHSFTIAPSSSSARNVRSIINLVKQRYDVINIEEKDMNTFEIFLDKSNDFDEVIGFTTKEIEKLH